MMSNREVNDIHLTISHELSTIQSAKINRFTLLQIVLDPSGRHVGNDPRFRHVVYDPH